MFQRNYVKEVFTKFRRQLVPFDRVLISFFFKLAERLKINGTSSSPVTNTIDGLSMGNKSAENVKSRHVVIRYGLLVLRRANLLGVQNSECKTSTAYIHSFLRESIALEIRWHAAKTHKSIERWMHPQRKFNLVDLTKKFLVVQLVHGAWNSSRKSVLTADKISLTIISGYKG